MNILVIGGAGYIGSHVTRAFLDKGFNVTVFDNLSSGREENLFGEAKFIKADILDYQVLFDSMKEGFDGLVHLAALKAAGESMIKPEKYSINNISGTINILNAATGCGINNIVFSSSAAVYGEPQYLPIDESHPTNPENYYGFTKLEIERFLSWYSRIKGIRYASLRYFNAAGYDVHGRIHGLERNPENLLPIVMEVAAGMRERLEVYGDDYDTRDGTCIRDYVHVNDLADAHIAALEYIHKRDKDCIVNLGSEVGVTVKEMLDTAREVTGQSIEVGIVGRRPGDPANLIASSNKAKKLFSWKANYSDVNAIVSSTWEVYKSEKRISNIE